MEELTQDWREFLSLLISHRVRYVVVGGHAVAIHARPRVTEDLDVFVEASRANAHKLRRALVEFGFGESAPDEELLATPGKVFMIGVPPFRIDLLTEISGVRFEEAWADRVRVKLEVGTVAFISRSLLIRNKKASGRDKDLADLVMLGVRGAPRKRRKRRR